MSYTYSLSIVERPADTVEVGLIWSQTWDGISTVVVAVTVYGVGHEAGALSTIGMENTMDVVVLVVLVAE